MIAKLFVSPNLSSTFLCKYMHFFFLINNKMPIPDQNTKPSKEMIHLHQKTEFQPAKCKKSQYWPKVQQF